MMLPACQQTGLVRMSVTVTRPSSMAMSSTMPISNRVSGTPVAIEQGSTMRASASRTWVRSGVPVSDLADMAGGVGGGERGERLAMAPAARELVLLDRVKRGRQIKADHPCVVLRQQLALGLLGDLR